jgi:hypothetical protein
MRAPFPLVISSAALLVSALALTGCAAGGAGAGSGGGSDVQRSALASASAIAGATGASQQAVDPTKVCTLASVTAAQAAVAATPPITFQADSGEIDGGVQCGYTSDDHATILVNVMVFPSAGSAGDLQSGAFDGQPLSPVGGIGSKAAVGSGELDAVVGSKGLVVLSAGDTDLSQEQLVALAKLVAPRIR